MAPKIYTLATNPTVSVLRLLVPTLRCNYRAHPSSAIPPCAFKRFLASWQPLPVPPMRRTRVPCTSNPIWDDALNYFAKTWLSETACLGKCTATAGMVGIRAGRRTEFLFVGVSIYSLRITAPCCGRTGTDDSQLGVAVSTKGQGDGNVGSIIYYTCHH